MGQYKECFALSEQLIAENNKLLDQIPALNLGQLSNDPLVNNYFGDLLQEIKLKQ